MHRDRRRPRAGLATAVAAVAAVAALAVLAGGAGEPVTAAATSWGQVADTTPTRESGGTEPTTPVDTTAPDTEPDATATSTPDDTLVGAGTPDDDVDPLNATLAIIGFVALVGLASWWMVRRDDPDAAPMPPGRPPDDGLI